jgi:hypothetical protein
MIINWSHPRTLTLVLWSSLLIAVLASRWLYVVSDALNVALVVFASVIVPGLLLALLLGWWGKEHPVEFLAGGITLGLAVALITVSIMVRFRIPVNSFWVYSFTFSALLGVLNWRYGQPLKPSTTVDIHGTSPFIELRTMNRILAVLLVLVVGAMIFLSIAAFGGFPTMRDFEMVDKKNYIPVAAMYATDIENVGLSPTDRNLIRPSIQRLLWSGWLYLQAFWSEASQVPILTLIMRDLRASLILLWAIINYALLYRLFKHHGLALFGSLAQAYFVNFMFAALFLYRLEEDKWMTLYVMVPAALYVLLRTLDTQTWRSYLGLLLVMLALGLIHPIGSPAMLLIAAPFVVSEYVVRRFVERQKISVWSTVIILIILLSGLVSPLFDRLYLTQQLNAPYTVVDSPTNPGFGYAEVAPIDPLMLLPVYAVALMLLFVLRDRNARFISIALIVLWLMLYTTPGAYFGARLVTRAQLWRMRLIIPFGLAWAWWLSCTWKGIMRLVNDTTQQRYIMSGIVSAFLVLMIGIAAAHHGNNLIPWLVRYQNLESLSQETYDALTVFADAVDDEREVVLADPRYTLLMPTVFVKSQHIYYSFPEIGTPLDSFTQLYTSPTAEALNTIIAAYNPRYIIAAEGSMLDEFLSSNNTDCCQLLMTNFGQVMYVVNPH